MSVVEKSGFQLYAAAMEKQSLTQGQSHKETLRRVAAYRHGEDFTAYIDSEYSCNVVCDDSVGVTGCKH